MNRLFLGLVSWFLLPVSIGLCRDQAVTLRVASISFEPVKFDLSGNSKTFETWFGKAAEGGAKIAGNLHYLKGDNLLGKDDEDTVDSSHPTDLRFLRQASAFEAALRPILADSQ